MRIPSPVTNAVQEDEVDADINKIEISFDYTRMSTHASNQIAVWVEDKSGQLIKTIYVSDFTAVYIKGHRKSPTRGFLNI